MREQERFKKNRDELLSKYYEQKETPEEDE